MSEGLASPAMPFLAFALVLVIIGTLVVGFTVKKPPREDEDLEQRQYATFGIAMLLLGLFLFVVL